MQAGRGNSPNWEHYKLLVALFVVPPANTDPAVRWVSVNLHSLLFPAYPGAAHRQIPTWLRAGCLDLYVSAVIAKKKGVETVILFSQRIIKHLN